MKKTTNKYNCPAKIWNKFSEFGKIIYNGLYNEFVGSENYLPVWDKEKAKREVVAHNLACRATWIFEKPILDLFKNNKIKFY